MFILESLDSGQLRFRLAGTRLCEWLGMEPRGCVAEVILEDTLLEQLQAGATATFIIFQTPEEGVGIPIALTGFGDGFANLP